jgi:hypothetical protein
MQKFQQSFLEKVKISTLRLIFQKLGVRYCDDREITNRFDNEFCLVNFYVRMKKVKYVFDSNFNH